MRVVFDAIGYARRLEKAGFTREQAEIQAEMMREQNDALRRMLASQETQARKELATKGDVRESELRLQKEIEHVKYDVLKWHGMAIALGLIMARGFGWLGF